MLSVIVASKNDEQYLSFTLDSLIVAHDEFNVDLECIVVDKNSTDNTKLICENYCNIHSFIRMISMDDDKQVIATAFNIGLQEMCGDNVLFVEAGFAPNPEYLQIADSWLNENKKDRAVVISKYFNIMENDKLIECESYWNVDEPYGPNISSCIFQRSCIYNTQFENIPFSPNIFAMCVIKYNFHNFNKYILHDNDIVFAYDQFRKEHDDKYNEKQSEEFQDSIYCHVKYLQYMPVVCGYKFCLDDNQVLIERGKRPIWNMDYHITDKCNLNCKYCNHFCSIVPKDTPHKSLEQIYKDLEIIAHYKDMISNFTILGGEPLLHPDLKKILSKARELMPNNIIMLTTNGTLYKRLEELESTIRDNNISVQLSLYPVHNTQDIQNAFFKYIRTQNLQISRIPTDSGFCKRMLQEDIQENLKLIHECPRRRCCSQFVDGKLYICHYAAGLHYLKSKFGDDIKIKDDDCFLEIKNDTKSGDIIRFLYNHIPDVCRHCYDVTMYNLDKKDYDWDTDPWTTTTGQIDEFYRR